LALTNHKFTGYSQWDYSRSKTLLGQIVTRSKKIKINGVKSLKYFTDTLRETATKVAISIGTRTGYTSVNNEFFVTPRLSLSYYPSAYMVKNNKIIRRNYKKKY
jgi:hypothetical protein